MKATTRPVFVYVPDYPEEGSYLKDVELGEKPAPGEAFIPVTSEYVAMLRDTYLGAHGRLQAIGRYANALPALGEQSRGRRRR